MLRFDSPTVTGDAADGVLGQALMTTNLAATPPTAASLFIPFNVTVAPDGTLWVSDFANHRVLGFLDAAGESNGANADIVLGQADFVTGSAQPYNAPSTGNPRQVAIGQEGSLFVGEDSPTGRVKRWSDPVTINAPKKVSARGSSAVVKGSASGAVSVAHQVAGQGGFKPVVGSPASWQVKVKRLKKPSTSVRIQAQAFDGRTATAVVKVKKAR